MEGVSEVFADVLGEAARRYQRDVLWMVGHQELRELDGDTLLRDVLEVRRKLPYGLPGRRIDVEAELGRETEGAEHAKGILLEALLRLADGADDTTTEVLETTEVIHDAAPVIDRHRVDREVAAREILMERRRELHHARVTTIEVGAIDPIGRDLIALPDRCGPRPGVLRRTTGMRCAGMRALRCCPARISLDIGRLTSRRRIRLLRRHQHRHGAMLDPGVDGASEHRLHLLRTRTRRDVPVARNPPEETVAHTATDRVGLVARTLQLMDDIFYI